MRRSRARGLGCLLMLSSCGVLAEQDDESGQSPQPASADGAVSDDAEGVSTLSMDSGARSVAADAGEGDTGSPRVCASGVVVEEGEGVIIVGNGVFHAGSHFACSELRGSGRLVTQVRQVDRFDALRISGQLAAELTRGPHAVRLWMDENLLEHLSTAVHDGELAVGSVDPRTPLIPSPSARVYVASPRLGAVTTEGAVSLRGETSAEDLTLAAGGASLLSLAVSVERALRLSATGTAELTVSGSARTLVAAASGSARIASTATVDEAEVVASGAAHVLVQTSRRVVVHASGSAQVTVRGSPRERVVETTGVARVVFED